MASLARVYATLKRFMPPGMAAWADDTSQILKELHAVAVVLAGAADSVESIVDELMPDTTTTQIDRWEAILRNPTRLADSPAARTARNLVKLARTASITLAQLAVVLAPSFDETTAQVEFIESTRAQIDATLTDYGPKSVGGFPLSLTAFRCEMGRPWPGLIDDTGVALYLDLDADILPAGTIVSLIAPDGTQWSPAIKGGQNWYQTRTIFKGKAAGGRWLLTVIYAPGGKNLYEARLRISNDVDAPQIYRFYAVRDPALAGAPDLQEANRQFTKTARAHLGATVCERTAFTCDDARSLCDRDPVGV